MPVRHPEIVYSFGPFTLESGGRRLVREGEDVGVSDRQFDVLAALVGHRGEAISKDALIAAAWPGVAVTDNSLEQIISELRRLLGDTPKRPKFIQTVPRRGYRFVAEVTETRREERLEPAALDALLAPYRAWIEGRAALETLERDAVARAGETFAAAVAQAPGYAPGHLGLANACLMRFESTRADAAPDTDVLLKADHHAREACRLDAQSGEAWATLAFVMNRTGMGLQAIAAARRAVTLEPENWRHHLRLAYVSWGEERLRAAHRTLTLFPESPLARFLAATVHVARQAYDVALQELEAGAVAQDLQAGVHGAFGAVGLHWLLGLVHLARGDRDAAIARFQRELGFESTGQLYARECTANTWYALGATHLLHQEVDQAVAAFREALARVPGHPLALVGLAAALRVSGEENPAARTDTTAVEVIEALSARLPVEAAVAAAIAKSLAYQQKDAVAHLETALRDAPINSAGWTIPVEPLLQALRQEPSFEQVLARLRARAA